MFKVVMIRSICNICYYKGLELLSLEEIEEMERQRLQAIESLQISVTNLPSVKDAVKIYPWLANSIGLIMIWLSYCRGG
jgi:hypothetical protein